MKLPLAFQSNILVQPLGKELLIYNLKTNKTFHLNQTSTNIYQACEGQTTFDQLKNKYKYSDDLIYLTLDELRRNALIKDNYQSPFQKISRREAVKKVGLASLIVLPIITSVIAPSALSAASNCQSNQFFCEGSCRNFGFFQSNNNHCGMCGNRCPSGRCVATQCVN